MSGVPWPVVAVEPRGGTWVRVRHEDGLTADHDFSYLVGRAGVFAALTPERIPAARVVDGNTVGWTLPDGTEIDIAPDTLWDHALEGPCPNSSCEGWTPAHTVLVDVMRGEEQ